MNSELSATLDAALTSGELLQSSRYNIVELLGSSGSPVYEASVAWLADSGEWT